MTEDNKLHTSVRCGNTDAVLRALKENYNPNELGLFRWTPVHEASHNGERDILKLLLYYKGDVDLQDELHGNTPLHYAAREDNSACVTVLLKQGADVNICNSVGEKCTDIATPLCREIIEEFVNSHHGDEWKGEKRDPNNNPGMATGKPPQTSEVPKMPDQSAIGSLHLSFEFHQKILKVRVWQVSDLLLPPPQTSMIDSIFVRGYLIPDPTKKSNRKTENIQVEGSSKDRQVKGRAPIGGVQHIFSPSSFRFDTPLVYAGVTPEMVQGRSIRLEVCMTQKRSGKPFLMAMVHMPLKVAVKKPIRERYPLIPCMNYTIPNTMRVYNAKDIIIESSSSRSPLNSPKTIVASEKSALDVGDIDSVDVDSLIRNFDGSLSDTSSSDNEDDGIGSFEVKTSVGKDLESTARVDMSSAHADNDTFEIDLKEVVSDPNSGINKETAIDIDSAFSNPIKKKIIPHELLEVVTDKSESQEKLANLDSTVVVVEEDLNHIVVDMPEVENLPEIKQTAINNTVIDMETTASSIDKDSGTETETVKKKKKIIPLELSLDDKESEIVDRNLATEDVMSESMSRSIPESMFDSGVVFDDLGSVHGDMGDREFNSNNIDNTTTNETSNSNYVKKKSPKVKRLIKISANEDDEISKVLNHPQKLSVSDVCDPSQTPASRPDTPIWDDFDFVEEEAKEEKPLDKSSVGDSISAPKVEGKLAESIARLGRTMTTLDLDTVAEPVVPPVILDDFDMEEDS